LEGLSESLSSPEKTPVNPQPYHTATTTKESQSSLWSRLLTLSFNTFIQPVVSTVSAHPKLTCALFLWPIVIPVFFMLSPMLLGFYLAPERPKGALKVWVKNHVKDIMEKLKSRLLPGMYSTVKTETAGSAVKMSHEKVNDVDIK
jgi:hypothetical protein